MRGLEAFLQQSDPKLFASYKKIRESSAEVWQDVKLPWLTDHGMAHSSRLARILDKILAPLNENGPYSLSPTEAFILLCSCYLHDIGMQDMRIDGLSPNELTEIRHQRQILEWPCLCTGHVHLDVTQRSRASASSPKVNICLPVGWCSSLSDMHMLQGGDFVGIAPVLIVGYEGDPRPCLALQIVAGVV